MRFHSFIFPALGLTALLTFSAQAKTVELTGTPAAVQAAIHAQMGEGKLDDIDQTNEDGETTFDVSYTTKSGDDHGFTVAEDGTVLSREVEMAATPAAVQKTIRARARGWTLEDINLDLVDVDASYEVDVSHNGREKSFTVADDGTLLNADLTLAETPSAVQAAINKKVADGTLESISEDFDPDGNSFDIDARAADGGLNSFSVGEDGTLLSVEVSLDKVSPGARKTIEAKIGNGKILRVDKSLVEKKGNVLPLEVQGRKDGKSFDFSVGPRGRFLGMDD